MAVNSKQNEIWRDIPCTEGRFQISNTGKIKNKKTGKERKPYINENGYCIVGIYNKNKKHTTQHRVHRMVAEMFLENPDGKRTVNHKDGNKQNNCVWNLEWATHQENIAHAHKTGLIVISEKQRKAASANIQRNRLLSHCEKQCYSIDSSGRKVEFPSVKAAANLVGGFSSAITLCCQGKRKTHKGYIWGYA